MRRLIPFAVSLAILALIYWRVDVKNIYNVFKNCHIGWILVSLSMVIPLTLLTAWRFQKLIPDGTKMRFGESNQLILAASTMNMVLPSKMGDLLKAYFIKDRGHLTGSLSLSLVVYEKTCDMLSLLLWCAFGLTLYSKNGLVYWLTTIVVITGLVTCTLILSSPNFAHFFFKIAQSIPLEKLRTRLQDIQESWNVMYSYFWNEKPLLIKISSLSILIWFLHLMQIWFFIIALRAWVPLLTNLALAPLAILAGLLPMTFAGIGTRDAALIELYQPFFSKPTAIALGILCTARYLLPAIAGLPFLSNYLSLIKAIKKN